MKTTICYFTGTGNSLSSPQWHHKCQQCLACINYCPEKSIQFGDKTQKTQRYHHPEITFKDIAKQKI